jgi:hypothetical protein
MGKWRAGELLFWGHKMSNEESEFESMFLFLFFGSTGVWTQSLRHARQVLYHLSHAPSTPFLVSSLSYSSARVSCFCLEPSSDCNPPASRVAGITDMPFHAGPFESMFNWLVGTAFPTMSWYRNTECNHTDRHDCVHRTAVVWTETPSFLPAATLFLYGGYTTAGN